MKPVLLLVPGMLNDASVWHDVVELLRPHADARIASPLQESVPAMAAAAWSLVADVPEQTPVVLAGFSLGGYVAIEMLAHPARRLQAAALVSTSARPETPEGASNREKTSAAMRKDFARVVDGIVQWSTHEPTPQLCVRLKQMMLGLGADAAIRQNGAISARGDHRDALAALSLPVTVLCGQQDRITPPALAQELAALIPGARLQLAEGAGHMLPCERPAVVAAALRPLLN